MSHDKCLPVCRRDGIPRCLDNCCFVVLPGGPSGQLHQFEPATGQLMITSTVKLPSSYTNQSLLHLSSQMSHPALIAGSLICLFISPYEGGTPHPQSCRASLFPGAGLCVYSCARVTRAHGRFGRRDTSQREKSFHKNEASKPGAAPSRWIHFSLSHRSLK